MCVRTVLDASAFRHVCETTTRTAGHQLRRWIADGDGVIVYSVNDETYAKELKRYREILQLLSDFRQRGRAILIGGDRVQAEEERVPPRPIRRSNDPHILALAAVAEATVLLSCDTKLRADFVNTTVLPNAGGQRRSALPLKVNQPQDMTDVRRRQKFLRERRCAVRR